MVLRVDLSSGTDEAVMLREPDDFDVSSTAGQAKTSQTTMRGLNIFHAERGSSSAGDDFISKGRQEQT